MEYLLDKTGALTLFATHYHELTGLIKSKKQAKNLTVETFNRGGTVRFSYRLIEEASNQSFGLHVAKMAGIPSQILERATKILSNLENGHSNNNNGQTHKESNDTIPKHLKKIEQNLGNLDPFTITPLEAIQKIHELKQLQDDSSIQ